MRRIYARRGVMGVAVAILATSVATAGIAAINHAVRIPNISLLYLLVILAVAVYFGTGPALLASVLAVLQYDFFLLQPLYTFTINQAGDILAFVVFAVVATLTGQLAASARARADQAQRRAAESRMLYELGQALMSGHDIAEILRIMTERVTEEFRVDRCAIFVPGPEDTLMLAAETPRGARRERSEQATASWVYQRGEQVWLPKGDTGVLDRQQMYIPLRAADRTVGVMEVGRVSGRLPDESERRVLTSVAAQAALLLARAQGEFERQRLALVEEQDRLKSTLLNAVSHDLRTPLASIKASATTLLLGDVRWNEEQGREFLHAIDQEADRLNRLVGNLLDLSRMEAGVLRPVLEWYDVHEVVDGVMPRLRPLLNGRRLDVSIDAGIPAVRLDLVRIEELLINLVENAIKYAPSDSPIELRVVLDCDLRISVVDHGPGIPRDLRSRAFEAFVQGRPAGDRSHGTGLGLAICQGIARAHCGTIAAHDTPGGGATLIVTLPAELLDQTVPV